MPPFMNLSGKRIGNWTIIKRVDDYISPKGHPIPKWLCECVCGTRKEITSSVIQRGESKSCGCSFGSRRKDIAGKRFGKLVAMRVVGKEESRQTIWECRCDCGNTISVLRRSLIAGRSKSCGCRGKESWIAQQVKDYFALHHSAIVEYKIIKNPETGRYLPYDIYIPGGTYIELNGEQHYKYIPYFFKSKSAFEQRVRSDKFKKNFAKQYGTFIEVDLRKIKSTEEVIAYIENQI